MLKIDEIFVSRQGEGPNTGVPSLFIRLKGCNLNCSWCDSKHALYGPSKTMTANEIYNEYKDEIFTNIVITGGEPLLQQNNVEFPRLLNIFNDYTIEIETNGTIGPEFNESWISYNVSPKLASSGQNKLCFYEIFVDFDANFKYVVNPEAEDSGIDEVYEAMASFGIPANKIWLMPLGTDVNTISKRTRMLMQLDCLFNVSTRAHILFDVK